MNRGSTRVLLAEVLHTLLSHGGGRTLTALVVGFVVWLAMDVFAHAAAAVLEYSIDPLIGKGSEALSKALWHLLPPFLVLVCVVTWLWWWLGRNRRGVPVLHRASELHATRGLIANLSRFRGSDVLPTIEAIGERVRGLEVAPLSEPARESFVRDVFGTNWGPLAAAVTLHAPKLEVCWLICSKAVEEGAECAAAMIRVLVGGTVRVEVEKLEDQNSVEEMMLLVENLYSQASRAHDLPPEEVTADMTGGTAAMTAGMVLATLDDSRPVEYLTQYVPLVDSGGKPLYGEALRRVLRPVPTSPRMVAQAFGRFLARPTGDAPGGEAGH